MDEVQLMGVRPAAKVLQLAASTVSRYLDKHPDLVRQRDAKGNPLIDPDEVRRHREATVNVAMSRNHAGQVFGEVEEESPRESHSQAAAPPPPAGPRLADERAGFEALRRRREEVKFARELGQLADVAEIEDAGREIGGLLQREAEAVFGNDLVLRIRRAPDDRRALAEIEAAKDELFARLTNEANVALRAVDGADDGEAHPPDAEE